MRKFLPSLLLAAALALAALAAPAGSRAAQAEWPAFWSKFKAAVVKGEKPTVLALSASSQMPADYQPLFGTRARRRCFAAAKPVPDEQGGYSVFCGEQGYYFKQVDGQFRFVEGFAND